MSRSGQSMKYQTIETVDLHSIAYNSATLSEQFPHLIHDITSSRINNNIEDFPLVCFGKEGTYLCRPSLLQKGFVLINSGK